MSIMLSIYTLPTEDKPRGDHIFHLNPAPDTLWTELSRLGETPFLHVLETNGGYPWKGITTAKTARDLIETALTSQRFSRDEKYDRSTVDASINTYHDELYMVEAWDNS